MKRTSLENLLVETAGKAVAALRRRVSNVRYGPPGEIYYTLDGQTYSTPEPTDVMPVLGEGDTPLRWAVRQHLADKSTLVPTCSACGKPHAAQCLQTH